MSERVAHDFRSALPPREIWIHDPDVDGLLDTPLDGRGLADLDQLITLTKETVHESFDWVSLFSDVHHLQWYAHRYPFSDTKDQLVNFGEFRELVNRKTYIPRVAHNWIHRITLPPPVPSIEVMQYSIEAQRVAMSLSRTASLAVRLTRMKGIPEQSLIKRLDQEFEKYNLYFENARLIPKEFSLLALQSFEAKSPDDMLIVNRRLAKLALDVIPVRSKAILSKAA